MTKLKTVCVFGSVGHEALMITKDDEVYAMGPNTAGCLGLGNLQSTLFPKRVDALCGKSIIGFSYGSGPHVVAFTSSGEIFTWGHNGYCELGNGSTAQLLVPTLLESSLANKVVVEVACGSHHTLALTSEGEVFAWGWNNCGQIGCGMTSNQSGPRRVLGANTGKRVKTIACGQTSSVAVLDTGEVACGYAHTLALTDEGVLYAWGANMHGQLATGNKTNTCSPVAIAGDIGRIVEIAATHYGHISAAVTENSIVYMWGQCRGQSICEPIPMPYASLHEVFACCATPSVMWKPITVSCDKGTSVIESLSNAFDDQTHSDLTIMVQGRPIYVHKAILKIRCNYFRSMFQEHWQEDNSSVLELSQFSYPVYKAFLQYLYTDQVDLPPENALELLDLASAYCEVHLKQQCEKIITQGITIENAAMLYSTAIAYQAKELEEFCFKFALNHMTAIIESPGFNSLDESTVKNFIRKAAKAGAFKS